MLLVTLYNNTVYTERERERYIEERENMLGCKIHMAFGTTYQKENMGKALLQVLKELYKTHLDSTF